MLSRALPAGRCASSPQFFLPAEPWNVFLT